MSNLSSQAGPPTLKNLEFAQGICYFVISPRFPYRDALAGVRGLSWAPFWPSWGALGGSFGGLVAFRWLPEILKLFLWAPWSPQIASRRALDSPQQRSRRPHREAEGPAKPPRPLRRRISAYPLTILKTKSKKNASKGHRQGISEATLGLSTSMFFLSFLLVMFFFCLFF